LHALPMHRGASCKLFPAAAAAAAVAAGLRLPSYQCPAGITATVLPQLLPLLLSLRLLLLPVLLFLLAVLLLLRLPSLR
jgi:hypothetical protein